MSRSLIVATVFAAVLALPSTLAANHTDASWVSPSIDSRLLTGTAHSCLVEDEGLLKCWGEGGSGQLGKGNTNDLGDGGSEMGTNLTAIDLGTNKTAIAIAAGSNHTCALLNDGTVKCWGEGGSGQLGQGNTNDLGDGGSEMGANLSAIDLGTNKTAVAVSAGGSHTCALMNDGTV